MTSVKQWKGRGWLLGMSGAVLFSAVEAVQNSAHTPGVGWFPLFMLELPVWLFWVAVAPLVFAWSRRFPIDEKRWPVSFVVHFMTGVAIALPMIATVNGLRLPIGESLVAAKLVSAAGQAYVLQNKGDPFWPTVLNYARFYATLSLMMYFALIALERAFSYHKALLRKERRERELHIAMTQSQLDALRTQLHPHFLFNTLNSISSLMSFDVAGARLVLAELGEMLRESLRDEKHEIPLSDELRFVERYVFIQQTRFHQNLSVHHHIASDTLECLVPRMLVLPFIENAVVHGMYKQQRLNIMISAQRDGQHLVIRIADDGRGFAADQMREGIGIGNTRKRLQVLYEDQHRFDVNSEEGRGADVVIRIPARPVITQAHRASLSGPLPPEEHETSDATSDRAGRVLR